MKLHFLLDTMRPDQRQYRQTSLELHPTYESPVVVEVEIPDDTVIEAEMIVDIHPAIVINLAGLREIANQFDFHFLGLADQKSYNSKDDFDFDDNETNEDDFDFGE